MALIVITLEDNAQGDADVGVQAHPALDPGNPSELLTSAQHLALNMLHAAANRSQVVEDRGLIQLIR